jgi:hypothetical protein
MLTSTLAPIGAPAIAVAAMRGVAVITFMPVARSASLLEPTRLGDKKAGLIVRGLLG